MIAINEADFQSAGLEPSWHNEGKHFQARGQDVVLSGWPTNSDAQGRCKWMAFGKVFQASPSEVLRAYRAGRFRMPTEASEAKCRSCGAPIWWIKTKNGKNIPLDYNGDAHFSTCPHADQRRHG